MLTRGQLRDVHVFPNSITGGSIERRRSHVPEECDADCNKMHVREAGWPRGIGGLADSKGEFGVARPLFGTMKTPKDCGFATRGDETAPDKSCSITSSGSSTPSTALPAGQPRR
jgi:hypothetical protein